MKLKDFDFRIWNGKKYLKQKIYNDNINNNEYIAVTGNIDDENYVFTIEHGCERDYYGGDYDEYCKVKDFTTCNYEIELFTGLYDKKGKKVYENDIVKVKSLYDCFVAKIRIHKAGTFYFEKKYGDYLGSLIYLVEDKGYIIETIGNIHENKELLEGE
ncbi:YopX family protein [Campylobacter coli]|uniref:YopX family protein n=1 Tax=Campylobacter coli TaxID=195 RepID=UPI0040345443